MSEITKEETSKDDGDDIKSQAIIKFQSGNQMLQQIRAKNNIPSFSSRTYVFSTGSFIGFTTPTIKLA